MAKVDLVFQREAKVLEKGIVSVEVSPGDSPVDIYKKAFEQDFNSFITTERNYTDDDWNFEIMMKKEDNNS